MSALASYLVAIGWNSQEASFVGVSQAESLQASGNNSQANGYAITATINNFTTVTSSNNSARLPAIAQHKHAWIFVGNSSLTIDNLNLFPASGESIGIGIANLPITIPSQGGGKLLFPVSATKWVAI